MKWLAESRNPSTDSDGETAQTLIGKKPTSHPKEKVSSFDADSVITLPPATAAGPEEENILSFDIYMSVGNTQNP